MGHKHKGRSEKDNSRHTGSNLGAMSAIFASGYYKRLALALGVGYAIVYMFTTGIFQVLPYPVPELVLPRVPGSLFYADGPIGQFPLFQFFFTRTFMFSISLSASVFIAIQATLVGLMLSMIIYNLRVAKCSCKETYGIATYGLAQGVFSVFACCGGGLLLLTIGSAGFATLRSYSLLIPVLSIIALLLSLFLMSKRISKTMVGYDKRAL